MISIHFKYSALLLISFFILGCKKHVVKNEEENTPIEESSPHINITGTTWTSVQGCPVLPNHRIQALASIGNNLVYTFITSNDISGRFDGSTFYLGTQTPFSFGGGSGIEEIIFTNGKIYGLADLGADGVLLYNPDSYWTWGEVISGLYYKLGTNALAFTEFNNQKIVGCGSSPHVRIDSPGDWIELGNGLDGPVFDLEPFNGELIAGGSFNYSGSTPMSGVARWDGVNWLPMGEGLDGLVNELVVFQGQLIAFGRFLKSGSGNTDCRFAAVWNGTSWEGLGGGIQGGYSGVFKALIFDDQLFIAGDFESAGGKSSKNIIKWTLDGWEALPSVNDPIGDMTVFNNHLYIVNAVNITNGNFLYRLD